MRYPPFAALLANVLVLKPEMQEDALAMSAEAGPFARSGA